jgi:hypothetical protein
LVSLPFRQTQSSLSHPTKGKIRIEASIEVKGKVTDKIRIMMKILANKNNGSESTPQIPVGAENPVPGTTNSISTLGS